MCDVGQFRAKLISDGPTKTNVEQDPSFRADVGRFRTKLVGEFGEGSRPMLSEFGRPGGDLDHRAKVVSLGPVPTDLEQS